MAVPRTLRYVILSFCLIHINASSPSLFLLSDNSTAIPDLLDLSEIHLKNGVPSLLRKKLLSVWAPFVPLEPGVSEGCRNDSLHYLRDLNNFDLRALSMYDASAKLSPGLLRGNINHYGDIDECFSANAQYCLAYIELKVSETDSHTLDTIHRLMHAHYMFKSSLDDPGHRVPRFSAIHWGLCVPSACTPHDVELSLSAAAKRIVADTGFKATVKLYPEMCQKKTADPLPTSTLLVGSLFCGLVVLILAATLHEFLHGGAPKDSDLLQCFNSFSLIKNTKKLVSMTPSADDISSVHGIRCGNAIMLYFSHKAMAIAFNPYVNRTSMAESVGRQWTVPLRSASLYTDPFIMMSGLLTAYSLGKQMQRSQTINVKREVLSRIMRLLPTLGALILFCTFILPFTSDGPQWPLVVAKHSEICKSYWWRNMLFIHNYFGFKNMCLTHTHHVGIDMQLFMASPILIYVLYKWPRQGFLALAGIATISTFMRFYTVFVERLSIFIYFGDSVSKMFQTADNTYILPTHRATVYVMGIALGYILRTWGRDVKLKNSTLTLGWLVALCSLYQSFAQPANMALINYSYDPIDAANYAAFSPITWCIAFAWLIFISHTGNGGFISKVASWNGFQISTRLAYTFYLTQFPIFLLNVGRVRTSSVYSLINVISPYEIASVVTASVILTLFVEMPFSNLRDILMKKPQAPKEEVKAD